MSADLLVSEVFGPTLQGEGPLIGTPAMFLRLGLCNLSCSWCDTPYTWDWSRFDRDTELTATTPDDLRGRLSAAGVQLVVVTGGEPLVQQLRLRGLLRGLQADGHILQVETNGTVIPDADTLTLVDHWSISPKLPHAGNPASAVVDERTAATARLMAGRPGVAWKFVAATVDDLALVDAFITAYRIPPESVWIMAEGTTRESQARPDLAEATLHRGWHYTPRLHVILWGDERGR